MQQKGIQSVNTCNYICELLAKCVLERRGTNWKDEIVQYLFGK